MDRVQLSSIKSQREINKPCYRNIHVFDDFLYLSGKYPELKNCIKIVNGKVRINYSNPKTVYLITKVLFHYRYNITWNIPDNFLVPTIPSRANYIHLIADLLTPENISNKELASLEGSIPEDEISKYTHMHEDFCSGNLVPKGKQILGLDIGIGANCVFSLLCNKIYSWNMIGIDISAESIKISDSIIRENKLLDNILLFKQDDPEQILFGVLDKPEITKYNLAFTICNPPYYKSIEESEESRHPNRYRFCQKHEITTHGGELKFIQKLYRQSKHFPKRVIWYTSQVSKMKNLKVLKNMLRNEIKANELSSMFSAALKQGKHDKWVIAWSFFKTDERVSILKFLRCNLIDPRI
ncbi:Ribosomal RNA large subunit methyltransferase F [Cryptosporidium felis]|nr:Ribosomal RNA large subunit methyltransferase F [Cryptosporidium felis]